MTDLTKIDTINDIWMYVDSNSIDKMLYNATKLQRERRGMSSVLPDTPMEKLAVLFNEINFQVGNFSEVNFEYISGCITDLKENLDRYKWVFDSIICDKTSRDVFFNLLAFRVSSSTDYLKAAYCSKEQYFDESVISFSNNEVFVDCGACTGDTVYAYILRNPSYKKIYAYEVLPENVERCRFNLKPLIEEGSVKLREYAVTEKACDLYFATGRSIESGTVSNTGELSVKGISLDDDILEPVTFIKMDIEGSEIDAIKGARRHITEEAPKLAICVYHKINDIWKIPELIYSINPNYTFALRHHAFFHYNENVFYAIPKDNKNIDDAGINALVKRLKHAAEFIDTNYKELQNYARELYEAKLYFIGQLESYEKITCELRAWISQLEEGKNWIEGQYYNYKYESEKKDKIIEELQQELNKKNGN